jgi:hypothetical protein
MRSQDLTLEWVEDQPLVSGRKRQDLYDSQRLAPQ